MISLKEDYVDLGALLSLKDFWNSSIVVDFETIFFVGFLNFFSVGFLKTFVEEGF